MGLTRTVTIDRNADGSLHLLDQASFLDGDDRFPQNMKMVVVRVSSDGKEYRLLVPVSNDALDMPEPVLTEHLTRIAEKFELTSESPIHS